jgi:hypothetical protein
LNGLNKRNTKRKETNEPPLQPRDGGVAYIYTQGCEAN